MVKGMVTIVIAIVAVVSMGNTSYATMCGEHAQQQQSAQAHTEHGHGAAAAIEQKTSEASVNVGNKVCPVSGEKVGQAGMELVTYEYEGKIYNLCCAHCVEEFKKDPEKYVRIVEEEMKTQ